MGNKNEVEKDLEILQTMKFVQSFLILITITASYLNVVTANNPWSLDSQFSNPTVMLVLLGNQVADAFFTFSAIISFFKVNKMY